MTPPVSRSARSSSRRSAACEQAQQNAQDAVSLVQTADGAMNEVQSMLQRVRDLAVEYNNGTLSSVGPGGDHERSRPALRRSLPDRSADEVQRDRAAHRRRDHHLPGRRQRRRDACPSRALKLFGIGSSSRRRFGDVHFSGSTVTLASIDAAIDIGLDCSLDLRRGAEPAPAHAQQPGLLPGEPERGGELASRTSTWRRRW